VHILGVSSRVTVFGCMPPIKKNIGFSFQTLPEGEPKMNVALLFQTLDSSMRLLGHSAAHSKYSISETGGDQG
jgi:hypothetical protein